MLSTIAVVCALRKLRLAWQEDAGDTFPQAVLTELLVLYDVGKLLDLNIFQLNDVLGDEAHASIKQHLNTYIFPSSDAYEALR
ncbi:MAG: hypothetical protein R2932_48390 [Caldilineaceae bacterium]